MEKQSNILCQHGKSMMFVHLKTQIYVGQWIEDKTGVDIELVTIPNEGLAQKLTL